MSTDSYQGSAFRPAAYHNQNNSPLGAEVLIVADEKTAAAKAVPFHFCLAIWLKPYPDTNLFSPSCRRS